jgi:hypothetical protein
MRFLRENNLGCALLGVMCVAAYRSASFWWWSSSKADAASRLVYSVLRTATFTSMATSKVDMLVPFGPTRPERWPWEIQTRGMRS